MLFVVGAAVFLGFEMPDPVPVPRMPLSLGLKIMLEVSDLESSRPRARAGAIVRKSTLGRAIKRRGS